MTRTRTPLVLMAALGLALAGQVVLPTMAHGATPQSMAGLASIDAPGLYDLSTADQAIVTITGDDVAVTGTAGALTLVLVDGVELTLSNASITGGTAGPAIGAATCTGGCDLKLLGTNTMAARSGSNEAGVHVPSIATLNIYGPGSLTATGAGGGAGIGGSNGEDSGAITIQHATVVAQGGADVYQGGGAGIGGGAGASGGPITLVNSSVTATGGTGASHGGGGAGIGGGGGAIRSNGGSSGAITITASVVTAIGGVGGGFGGGGAGIGGGGGGNEATGGAGTNVTVDTSSAAQATGGPGPGFGGGGAAVGGGGSGLQGGVGGSASTLAIAGSRLAANSAGGGASDGGNGALCGTGGGGYAGGGINGTAGAEAALVGGGTCAVDPTLTVDLTGRPDPAYAGYPTAPSFTDPVDAAVTVGDNATFTVAPHDGVGTFQWQESTDGGVTWDNVVDGADYDGADTDTLTLFVVPLTMNGNLYRCLVDYTLMSTATSDEALLTVTPIPVTFTAIPADGVSGTIDTTALQLKFSPGAVTGLTAGDITLTDGSGQATKGALSEASGSGTNTVWLLELTSVDTEGNVSVAVADFGDFTVTNSPQNAAVYKYTPPYTTVDFSAFPVDGASGLEDTTTIQLEFDTAVTGLDIGHITVTDDTGQIQVGTLTPSGGTGTDTTWFLEVTSVDVEGQVKVEVADFDLYQFTGNPQMVDVYRWDITRVTFTPTQVGGVSTLVDSTGIELTFSEAVTGLAAGDITVTDDTGEVTVGALSEATGTGTNTVWLLELDSVEAEGEVIVAIADFGDFTVTSNPQSAWVYRATRFLVTINQVVGGSVMATPLRAFEGETVTLQAAAVLPFRFAGWKVDPAVTWVGGDASTLTARFVMPDGDVEVTPAFVLAYVNPPPGPNNPIFNPDVIAGPEVVPPPPPGTGNAGAAGYLPYTGDNQSSTAAGLALLASLMGIFALALRRKHQPSSYCARHRGVAASR